MIREAAASLYIMTPSLNIQRVDGVQLFSESVILVVVEF